ncbi:MAG TPA: S8 family serine peptidase, partial [Rheinheimera sp.]|nr:S8 family serine peptidase [Rheinheimera sp.]
VAAAGLKPELAAPGSNIVAPYLAHETAALDGTSMASPHVAGAAALLRQLYPQASAADIRGMLMAGSIDLGLMPYEQGAGRLDIAAATQVSFYADKGILAFGNIDNSLSEWQSNLPLTLHNLTSEDITITLALSDDIPSTMPVNVSISWPQQNYVIPANASLSIEVRITVSDAQSLPYPDNGAYAFVDRLVISSAQQSLTVPVTFDKATEITITMDAQVAGNVTLHSDDYDFEHVFYMAEASILKIKVPQKPLNAKIAFEAHSTNYYPQFNLPDSFAIISSDIRRIDPVANTTIEFKLSDIDTLVGFNELLDANGDKTDTDDIKFDVVSYGNYYYDDNQNYGFFGIGFDRPPLLGFSSQHSFSHAEVGASGVLPFKSQDEPSAILLLQRTLEHPAAGLNLFTPSLQQLRDIKIWLPTQQSDDVRTVAYNLSDRYGDSIGHITETSAASIMVSLIPELATQSLFNIGIVDENESWFEYQIISPLLKPLETIGIEAKQYFEPNQFSYPSDLVDFRLGGSYFSGTVFSLDNGIHFYTPMSTWLESFVADINLHRYSHALLSTQLSWLCNSELQQQYNIHLTQLGFIPLPELPCDLPTLKLGFNSWLHGTPYWSELTLTDIDTTNFAVPSINNISVFEAEQNVSDQIVNRLDARLVIHLPYEAENLRAELKLGNGDFLELALITALNSADYVSFALPMVAGEHVASIRLTYGYNNNISQTLNGLFLLGADAGEADVDGDGTPNRADTDNDNDGVNDSDDAFPYDPT